MTNITFELSYYVDIVDVSVKYDLAENCLGLIMTGELYWWFNGRTRLAII